MVDLYIWPQRPMIQLHDIFPTKVFEFWKVLMACSITLAKLWREYSSQAMAWIWYFTIVFAIFVRQLDNHKPADDLQWYFTMVLALFIQELTLAWLLVAKLWREYGISPWFWHYSSNSLQYYMLASHEYIYISLWFWHYSSNSLQYCKLVSH